MTGARAIWFDCDGCLVDALTGTTARPGASDLLRRIRQHGGAVVAWSSGGVRHVRRRMELTGLSPLVDAVMSKGPRGTDGRWTLPTHPATLTPCAFVDDQPADVPATVATIRVPPFIGPNDHDRALHLIEDHCLRLVARPAE